MTRTQPRAVARGISPKPSASPPKAVLTPRVLAEAIAQRAYEKFVARGRVHGFDQLDWLEAERELRSESPGQWVRSVPTSESS